jgi:hypothetical protein
MKRAILIKWVWFIGLWIVSVAILGMIAMLIRAMIL